MDQRGAGTCQGHTAKLGKDQVFSVRLSGVTDKRQPSTAPANAGGLPGLTSALLA